MTMDSQVIRDPWPTSAKVTLIAIGALAILVAVPWLLMWTTMAAWCAPMMNAMRDMMNPGMMR
jgi:hypothetical protein